MINLSIKSNVKIPDINLLPELEFIAKRIVIPELAANIQAGVDVQQKPYPPLAPSTIKRKGHARPLVETGKLHRSFVSFSGQNHVVVTLNSERKQIGGYLQLDGIRTKMGKRFFNFFGVSSIMEIKALKYMEKRIRTLLNAK